MDWRPKDWNVKRVYDANNCYPAIAMTNLDKHLIELGADAMLEALRAVHSLEGFERMTEVILKPEVETIPLVEG